MRISFLERLPARSESTLAGAIHALETNDPLVAQSCSSLEAPSAIAVVRELFPRCVTTFAACPTPDPREPWWPVPFVLWRYDGTTARPAFPRAAARVDDAISSLAREPYSLVAWSAAADTTAGVLADAGELFGAMLHAPAKPPGETLWEWRFKCQVATALVISRIEERAGRNARWMLRNIVYGPVDWTTTASIIALLDLARRRPEERQGVGLELLNCVRRPMTPIWFACGAEPALRACLDVPDLYPPIYEKLQGWLEDWEASDA